MPRTKNKQIHIDCNYQELIDLDKLFSIQENLKDAHDLARLKTAIIRNGIKFPVFVWYDKKGKMYKLIDGVHRVLACKELRAEGYQINQFPVVFIECATHEEAKELVLRASANYTSSTKDRFKKYIDETDLDLLDLTEELSHKDFSFLNDLLVEPDDLEQLKIKGVRNGSGRKVKVDGGDLEFTIFQLVFENMAETSRFWKLMTRFRNYKYKNEDYKDILFLVLKKEFGSISKRKGSQKK